MAGNFGDVMQKIDEGILIKVRAVPNAKKSSLEITSNFLKVKLSSPPVDGKANRELQKIMADVFGVRKSQIKIVKGEKSKDKLVQVEDLTIETAQELLSRAVEV